MQKITSIRKNKGITQEELSDLSNISLRTIQRIEKGNTTPRGYTLRAIATALDIDAEQLLCKNELESDINTKKQSVKTYLQFLNFSSILILPFSNIIFPLILWKYRKNNKIVDKVGRKIIYFQILWTICLSGCLLFTALIQILLSYFFQLSPGPWMLIIFLILYIFNLTMVIRTALQLRRNNYNIYGFNSLSFI